MAKLPREIWILVYVLCPDIQTAIRLSAVNQELHQIWLDKQEHIASTVLRPDIPAYDDAVRVARIETRADHPTKGTDLELSIKDPGPQNSRQDIHLWLPRLLENAQLAHTISAEWDDWLNQDDWLSQKLKRALSEHVDLESCTTLTGAGMYYFIREIAASYERTELRPRVASTLETLSKDTLDTLETFYYPFMCEALSNDMDKAHGIQRNTPIERWNGMDLMENNHLQAKWHYTANMIWDVWNSRYPPGTPNG